MLSINIKEKTFDNKLILKDFTLNLDRGEFISIIGPSGCGKSTLLKIISSLDKNYDGSIKYKNEIQKIKNLAYIFQDTRLLPWLSVKDNILLVAKNKDEKEVYKLLEEFGLKDYENSFIKELSGGMKRRVSLIRAFINKPELILLDEPFVSLDYPSAQVLRKLIYEFYISFKPIIIFVTHDLKEAMFLSNRILFLKNKPSCIILEYKNSANFDELTTTKKLNDLLSIYPNILSGRIK